MYIYINTRIFTYIHIITCCISNLLLSSGRPKRESRPLNFRLAADEAMRLQEELQARQLECDVRGGVWWLLVVLVCLVTSEKKHIYDRWLLVVPNWCVRWPPKKKISDCFFLGKTSRLLCQDLQIGVSIPCDVNILAIFWGSVGSWPMI